jgi:hypothetical protein
MAQDAAAHVVLLGDSVFDNTAYVAGGPDVSAHLRRLLPSGRVSCCAVDGTTTADMAGQLDAIPDRGTHLVLSLGGNDALLNADLLDLPVRSTAQALDLFRDRVAAFAESYGWVLEALVERRRPLTVCTIYHAICRRRRRRGRPRRWRSSTTPSSARRSGSVPMPSACVPSARTLRTSPTPSSPR